MSKGTKAAEPMLTEAIFVTPEMAKRWMEKNHPDNRPIGWSDVEALASDISDDHWDVSHQGICFDGQGRLIDGQHRLSAIILANKGITLNVTHNTIADIHNAIDRGKIRSLPFLTGFHTRELAALKLLHKMSLGNLYAHARVTMHEAQTAMVHHHDGMSVIKGHVSNSASMVGGLRAACVWTMPIDQKKTLDFLKKTLSGEMIRKGDPAYAFRAWQSKKDRHSPVDMMLAACNCLRFHLQDKSLGSVFTGEMGFRAATAKRRTVRAPYTPGTELVLGISWPISNRDLDVEAGKEGSE